MNLLFNIENKYKMPEEYKGVFIKNGGLTINNPRKWTKKEIEWVDMLKDMGFGISQIAECIDRDTLQVSIKLKRLGKKSKSYNDTHREEKYNTNFAFLQKIKPNSVLDLFAGEKSYYKQYKFKKLITNDIDKKFTENDYNKDALTACCILYSNDEKFDLIDIDPFGSAYDCFDLCIKMAQKGLIITLGEMGHKRFKRVDFVRRYYGIESIANFKSENLVNHIIKIGERNKKLLTPIYLKDWQNISRVYFEINKIKITEQWEKKN